ncbi:cullin-5-like [Dysidea avara]|uniref:cullin-5-like n=1 Tax=Dysidea avara TaxID=196820 RepID=UPI0033264EDF
MPKSSGLLKSQSDNKQSQFQEKWPNMKPVVLKLLRQQHVSRDEWQDLFWDVHLVTSWDDKGPMKIQKALEIEFDTFISGVKDEVLSHEDDSVLLKAYIKEWTKYFAQCYYLPLPFQAMETAMAGSKPTKKQADGNRVNTLMLSMWNTSIFTSIKDRLQTAAMKLLHSERQGDAFDSQLVVGVRESFVNLSTDTVNKLKIYQENFEQVYKHSAVEFYTSQASAYLNDNGIQNYMKYADEKLQEEEARAMRYLETRKGCTSVPNLMKECVDTLVKGYTTRIVAEAPSLIQNNEVPKLRLMYRLLNRLGQEGLEPLLQHLESFIKQSGLDDMKACVEIIVTDSEKYIEELLKLFTQYSKLVEEAFENDSRFLTSRDKAFREIVNETSIFKLELSSSIGKAGPSRVNPESKCPELLANYCDLLLRKTPMSRRLTSEEVEKKLKDVLLVLKYVQNKDVFMRYHKTHLTRRLILETSADSEMEENMVEWLREVGMPADYVNKLSRMFQDMKVSEDLNSTFKESRKSSGDTTNADLVNIKVLNAGAWSRSSERVPVTLPRELEDFIPDVEQFYRERHQGRKLHWHHILSNGVVAFQNQVGKFDLEVTTFQMAVLFAWNQRPLEKISFEDLRLATELMEPELRRTLWSLTAFAKMKRQVLLCEPPASSPRDFKPDSMFHINQEFALVKAGKVQKRGKVNLIGRLQLTTEKTKEEDNEGIIALRVLRTQEAIVKIMKMRKRITNAALQTELVEILKNMFIPPKKMIKEQIEWLIENKYMKRDDKNINTFTYLA